MKYAVSLLLYFFTQLHLLAAKPLAPPDTCTLLPLYLCTQPVISNIICPQFCLDTDYTITEAQATFNCSLTLMGNCVRYIALPGYFGTDVVTVIACNALTCDTNTVYIQVVATPDLCTIQTPPCQTETTTLCTNWNTATTLCPDFCFTQPYTLVSANSIHPATILIDNQCIVYTPVTESVSWDAIEVIACPDAGLCDTVLVNVTLGDCTLPPAITPGQTCTDVFTPIDLCFEMEAGEIYIADAITTTFQCSINAFAQSCITYYPLPGFSGADTVNIPICQTNNPGNCRMQQFIVYAGCQTPIAVNDIAYISTQWVSINGSIIPDDNGYDGITLQPLLNDDIGCQAPITISVLTPPANGIITIQPDGQQVQYLPNAGFGGTETITLQLCDACNQCSTSSLTIYVAPQTATAIQPTGNNNQPLLKAAYLPQNQTFLLTCQSGSFKTARIAIFNTNGQLLQTLSFASNATDAQPATLTISANELPAGLYFICLQTETGNTAGVKVWKQ